MTFPLSHSYAPGSFPFYALITMSEPNSLCRELLLGKVASQIVSISGLVLLITPKDTPDTYATLSLLDFQSDYLFRLDSSGHLILLLRYLGVNSVYF